MIKSVYDFKKSALVSPIACDGGIPEYQFDQKLLATECNLPEFDQFKLNAYYRNLTNEIASELAKDGEFNQFCPRIAQKSYSGFSKLHCHQKKRDIQGTSEIIFRVQEYIKDITGGFAVTTQPSNGASAKLTALKMVYHYFSDCALEKDKILYIGEEVFEGEKIYNFTVEKLKLGAHYQTNVEAIQSAIDSKTALVIISGIFAQGLSTEFISKVVEIAHSNGALCYAESCDFAFGLAVVKPFDLGIDIFEFNAEQVLNIPTLNGFSPIAVCEKLEKYLPYPYAVKDKSGSYTLLSNEKSGWQIAPFIGPFSAMVSLYCYLVLLGSDGLRNYAESKLLVQKYLEKKVKNANGLRPSECVDFNEILQYKKDK